ncbi:acetyl-CoA carboxylase biotin carboxylase subunit family protein [Cystobacter fuscus]|uniref:acetyl-CoA carboxylase biotin carboxylase subunit family protein n=1 Tax=Cystobacter fuscus TaxID=43 RepID=UPI0037BF3E51
MTNVLLVMRKGYRIHGDHIETMRRLGLSIHVLTEFTQATEDARFANAVVLSGEEKARAVEIGVKHSRAHGIRLAVTFQETDIEVCAAINAELGARTTSTSAAMTARDKSQQRRFLARHGLPSPQAIEVSNIEEACAAAQRIGYPVIVKPTRAASSVQVALVSEEGALRARLTSIQELARSGTGNYYQGTADAFALVEEFLPGNEVTLDGIVIDGRFHLGGIHNKMRMPGPFFEEDLYSLPFKHPDEEPKLARIAAGICEALGLENALFNVELRQDTRGEYRVVEFSPRISGGHVYRNVRDVYQIDLVAAHLVSCIPELAPLREHMLHRSAPRMATCIKFVYRDGRVVENHSGKASLSDAFTAYYPTAPAGTTVHSAPKGFDIAGLLSVKGRYREPGDIARVEQRAAELERELGLVVSGEST